MTTHNPFVVERIVTIDADFTELCQATVMHYNTREEAIRGAQASIMRCYPWREGELWAIVRIQVGRLVADDSRPSSVLDGPPKPSDLVKFDFILARTRRSPKELVGRKTLSYRN